MPYMTEPEHKARLANVRELMARENLDIALVSYDEFNIGNDWCLTRWRSQGHMACFM